MTALIDFARAVIGTADDVGLPVYMRIRSGTGQGLRISLRNASRRQLQGTYELPVQRALEQCLQRRDRFLDIGSNIGFFALIAARLVGSGGRVFAIEPVPKNVHCILHNAKVNGFQNIRTIEAAVGRTEGWAELLLARHSGGAALAHTESPADLVGSLKVQITTVDRLVAIGRIEPPNVVKIDVEGAELDVLEGMRATLSAHAPRIVFEVDAASDELAEARFEAVAEWLRATRHVVERLEPAYPELGWAVLHGVATPAGRR
jgi:FkbM family methyltransferase